MSIFNKISEWIDSVMMRDDGRITAVSIIKLRDYPVAIGEDGRPDEKSLIEAKKKREADLKWAIELDLKMANKRGI